jgi:hypothetical protein
LTCGTPAGLDRFFESAYRRELGLAERPDLQALWETVRGATLRSFQVLGSRGLPTGYRLSRPLRRLHQVIESEIPKLRRRIAGFQKAESNAPAPPDKVRE